MKNEYLLQLLGEDEKIILRTNQHWFVLVQSVIIEVFLTIATIVLVSLIHLFLAPNPLISLWYLLIIFPLVSLIRDVLTWRSHQYIVTTRRVIQIFGVINKNVTDSSLEKVNDVKMVQSFWGRIFDFGDIEILTASELGVNRFTTIGEPVQFKKAMLNAKVNLEKSGYQDIPLGKQDASTLLVQLSNLHQQKIISDLEYQDKKADLLKRI